MLDINTFISATEDNHNAAPAADAASQPVINVAAYFKKLLEQRDAWENGTRHASNQELYRLLANCLAFYEAMADGTDKASVLVKQFDIYVEACKLKFDGETHTVVKIVRAIFDNDRRQASAYGMVLRAALAANVNSHGLVEFINKAGGVEALRLSKTGATAETQEAKADKVWAAIKQHALAVVSSEAIKRDIDRGHANKRVVLLATQRADGQFDVHAVVKADSVVNNAFASQAAALAKAAQPANGADAVDAAVKAAIAAMQESATLEAEAVS